ncbi:MAG: GNAT family N-acetyltransferase [bacterium]|nr:GNAT family N-acetyltransferase [bacterium]
MKIDTLQFRPITEDDDPFLHALYASTRTYEMVHTGWDQKQINEFLSMQFKLQHKQYIQNYPEASFEIILRDNAPIGRLYVDRREKEVRILDIALLADYCGKGIGAEIMNELISECREKNLPLNLHVERLNPALRFYQRLGMKNVAENEHYFLMEIEPNPGAPGDSNTG